MVLVLAQELFGGEAAIIVEVPQQAGTDRQFFVVAGERVGLRVVNPLQLVLHIAEQEISSKQRLVFFCRDERSITERSKGPQRLVLASVLDLVTTRYP